MLKTLCLSLLAALALSIPAHAQPAAAQQSPNAAQTAVSLKLRWPAKPRVKRYRLQVALDQKFTDIVYDGAVVGLEQEVTGLQPGKYYWRVAPATPETGRYSAPVLVEATTTPATTTAATPEATPATTKTTTATTKATTATTKATTATAAPVATVRRPPADVGWQAAIGAVARPFAARLRAGKNFDLVALNSDGIIYALDGGDGTALWSARARGNAPAGDDKEKARAGLFTPLVVPATAETKAVVVVASADGVRGLDGETGRELWRTVVQGRLQSGAVAQLQGDRAAPEFVVATSDPDTLTVLEAQSGR
ncbi:MAG TPA: PQQ-binding-like beta-propeller repeat protein, partial [Pyrinomonadaceae bacterium]|nr:PQQ-binding-like beta-propeller repeat protein [Pyrinomonadaceae bacterium]